MELGTAVKYILTPNGTTPIGDKYFYRESQGLWFIVKLLERKESQERVFLTLQIEDILWRKGRHGIGESFTCSCTKNFYYPIWWIWTLPDGLQDFIDNIPNITKTKEKYPDLDLDSENDRIRLIKIAHGIEIYGSRKSDS